MKPTKLSVYELFENKRRYVVPLFQRPYVWTRDAQWQPLMRDIVYKADQILQRQNLSDRIGSHFLGAAVTNQIPTFGKQVPAQQIIDGQQRLTTLQVLISALRDLLHDIGHEEHSTDLDSLTENRGMKHEEVERYKVWPTIADRDAYMAILDARGPETLGTFIKENGINSSKLADAYFYFYQQIDEYVRFGEIDEEIESLEYGYSSPMAVSRIDALIEALQRHLEIVVIELEESDDAQIIFETLNARGVPLLPSDLIRNFVFLEAEKARDDINRLYRTYWQPFDDPVHGEAEFWTKKVRQGRLTRSRIDLFMFYYLTLKTGRDIKIPHLFSEFQRWWGRCREDAASVEDLLRDMRQYSEVYRRFVTEGRQSRLGMFIYRLDEMNTATVYPILLYLYGPESPAVREHLESMVVDLESYLVRRMICSLTTQNYNRTFLSVLRDLRSTRHVDRGVLQDILLGFEGDATRWPTDDEFRQQWRNNPVYRRIARGRVRMILEAIDLQMETTKQEKLHIDDKLTVEHVFPQHPSPAHWTELDEPDVVHTLGNLTLLTTALNSSVSNGPFARKREAIARQSKLRMNAEFQGMDTKSEWTVSDIIERANHLFDYALDIWPRPRDAAGLRLAAGQKRALESLSEEAHSNGIGEAFDILVAAGIRNGLYPASFTKSVMLTPHHNKKRTLFTVWVTPREDRCRVYVATNAFAEFFPLISEAAAQAVIGPEGWREMYVDDVEVFAKQLSSLLSEKT